jgi:hypothetical protein
MTLNEFVELGQDQQLGLIFQNGILIGHRVDGSSKVLLCHLETFYVEVVINRKSHEAQKVHAFETVDRLEPYLGQIDISELVPG